MGLSGSGSGSKLRRGGKSLRSKRMDSREREKRSEGRRQLLTEREQNPLSDRRRKVEAASPHGSRWKRSRAARK